MIPRLRGETDGALLFVGYRSLGEEEGVESMSLGHTFNIFPTERR